MAESFGCCSSYAECSNAGHCIHPDYTGCYYRKNLEAGCIFYGKNAGKKPEAKKDYKIYLTCYDQPFAVLTRFEMWKSSISYQLKPDKYEKIKTLFDNLEIPYIENLDGEFEQQDRQICDCRVMIEVGEDKYHILNFDSWLIPEKTAEGIRKAFEAKGIPAKVEKIGRWSAVDIPPLRATKKLIAVSVDKVVEPEPVVAEEKEIVYEQPSIFDLMGA